MKKLLNSLIITSIFPLFISSFSYATPAKVSVVISAEQVQWGYLNPLRGDKSPGAADLWGDRTKDTATGMLVRFNKGFSSPPHIHNISYRGVVIQGAMHNDDPTAGKMWMPTGSFWTQPAGENHITAADGQTNLIYLEIDSGPYLVKPSKEAFNNGELPINLAASNMVWVSSKQDDLATSFLWGSAEPGQTGGVLVKLPKGYKGQLKVNGNELKAVVISGELSYQSEEITSSTSLQAGSYFSSSSPFTHELTAASETTLYIRSDNQFQFIN
ncbi:DUF4437 domain-containing protein [Thalassotalea euphylliae]|uniref:DUF4437 domain-containing protein n=1 Tax=Thalassotalea euphylliae TaxID=1655234 RepID=UPI00363C9F80